MRIDEYPLQPRSPFPILAWIIRIFPWVFVSIGVGTLVVGVRVGIKAAHSRHWPTVSGMIESSKVVSEVQKPIRPYENDPTRSGQTVDRAAVVYTYQVDGRSYQGSNVSYGSFASSRSADAAGTTGRYETGKPVTVFYDPAQPGESVLEPGFSWGFALIPAIGGVFLLGGLAVARLVSRAAV